MEIQQDRGEQYGDRRAVAADEIGLIVVDHAVPPQPGQENLALVGVAPGLRGAVAVVVVRIDAQHLGMASVGEDQPALFGTDDDADRAVLQDAAQTLLVLLALALELLALGDVLVGPHRRPFVARDADALAGHHGNEPAAVVAHKLPLGAYLLAGRQQRPGKGGEFGIAFRRGEQHRGYGLADDPLPLDAEALAEAPVRTQDDAVGGVADGVGRVLEDDLLLLEQLADFGLLARDLLAGAAGKRGLGPLPPLLAQAQLGAQILDLALQGCDGGLRRSIRVRFHRASGHVRKSRQVYRHGRDGPCRNRACALPSLAGIGNHAINPPVSTVPSIRRAA